MENNAGKVWKYDIEMQQTLVFTDKYWCFLCKLSYNPNIYILMFSWLSHHFWRINTTLIFMFFLHLQRESLEVQRTSDTVLACTPLGLPNLQEPLSFMNIICFWHAYMAMEEKPMEFPNFHTKIAGNLWLFIS